LLPGKFFIWKKKLENNNKLLITWEEQNKIIKNLLNNDKLTEGDFYFIISKKWFEKWKIFTHFNEDLTKITENNESNKELFPITNINLVEKKIIGTTFEEKTIKIPSNFVNKENIEDKDFILVCEKVWNNLKDWYGSDIEIIRKVISDGTKNKILIEMFPLLFEEIEKKKIEIKYKQ
jgi:hypothetical protein